MVHSLVNLQPFGLEGLLPSSLYPSGHGHGVMQPASTILLYQSLEGERCLLLSSTALWDRKGAARETVPLTRKKALPDEVVTVEDAHDKVVQPAPRGTSKRHCMLLHQLHTAAPTGHEARPHPQYALPGVPQLPIGDHSSSMVQARHPRMTGYCTMKGHL